MGTNDEAVVGTYAHGMYPHTLGGCASGSSESTRARRGRGCVYVYTHAACSHPIAISQHAKVQHRSQPGPARCAVTRVEPRTEVRTRTQKCRYTCTHGFTCSVVWRLRRLASLQTEGMEQCANSRTYTGEEGSVLRETQQRRTAVCFRAGLACTRRCNTTICARGPNRMNGCMYCVCPLSTRVHGHAYANTTRTYRLGPSSARGRPVLGGLR